VRLAASRDESALGSGGLSPLPAESRRSLAAATQTPTSHGEMYRSGHRAAATFAAMTVRIARFAGEFAELAAWTGEPEERLRADQDYHDKEREHWIAWDGALIVGALHPWRGPDGRNRLYYDKCRADACQPLADAITGECYATVAADDQKAITALARSGFAENRRENEYEIPVARADAPVPDGIRIITADESDLEPLMLLDRAIRADIPGAEGWQPDPEWFRTETYDSPDFDPQTYRVALDGDDYVGLARIWMRRPPQPYCRLGCVGVLAGYRQRGLARALIARALAPLAHRGEALVTAEADATNIASHALLTSFGGRVTGATIELRRPAT
jgi:ribosomal protein S18 acetylase RimI-like enzyme